MTGRHGAIAVAACALVAAACAPKRPALPSGPGSPYPEAAAAYASATGACRSVHSLTAVLAASGKAGDTKIRGHIEAGYERPGKLRLEGVAPFGKPAFVLTAADGRGTLVLPRADEVLENAAPRDIVDALAGVALDPDALGTVLAGCGFTVADAVENGRVFPSGAAAVEAGDSTTYLEKAGETWRVLGASRGPVAVTYSDFSNGRPATVRLRSQAGARLAADLTVRLSEVDTNVSINPRAFVADLPPHPVPISLQELRRAGPLGARAVR